MTEKNRRSFVKTLTWRVTATAITLVLVYLFTGEWTISVGVASAEVIIKMLAYYGHERTWSKIGWGRK